MEIFSKPVFQSKCIDLAENYCLGSLLKKVKPVVMEKMSTIIKIYPYYTHFLEDWNYQNYFAGDKFRNFSITRLATNGSFDWYFGR